MSAPNQEEKLPVAEVFTKAYNLFQDRNRWAKDYYQYDKDGNKCPWAQGYSFCALGALVFFGNGHSHDPTCLLQRVSEHLYGEHMQMVNDNHPDGYEKVLRAYEFAIELWTGREPTEEELGMKIPELLAKRNAQ